MEIERGEAYMCFFRIGEARNKEELNWLELPKELVQVNVFFFFSASWLSFLYCEVVVGCL